MPAKRKNANSKKKANPSLNLVLKRLDKFDQRFDALDRRIDAVDQKVDAVRQETAAEFKAVREEMAQGFDSLRQEFESEMKHVSDAAYAHYLRIETEAQARAEYHQQCLNNLQTSMDASTRGYDEYWRDKNLSDNMLRELREDVEELKRRDMEKAAAIEKIERQIKAA
ncbi:MAG: hypothetical protein ONB44_14685 [candidate division KSB1 bacterium]|nr:hypothetical protein [candidate division KSB1 bacterium]MDZ7303374.1 hypothetical protein [candidate division KSB1 bacterium]MDZ7312308.1 hypothetical protein [candidate division KSB1 bacterium]